MLRTTTTTSLFVGSVAIALGASQAAGVNVTANFLGTQAGLDLRVTRGGTTFDTFAGQYQHVISSADAPVPNVIIPGVYNMYCAQLGTPPVQMPATFNLDSFDNTIVDATANAGARSQLIADMFFSYGVQPGFTADNTQAAAFQLFVWEVLYDWEVGEAITSMSITGGNLFANELGGGALNAGVVNAFNDIVNSVNANAGSGSLDPNDAAFTAGMTSLFGQDQVFSPIIPAPGAASLIALGGVLAFVPRRRRA